MKFFPIKNTKHYTTKKMDAAEKTSTAPIYIAIRLVIALLYHSRPTKSARAVLALSIGTILGVNR